MTAKIKRLRKDRSAKTLYETIMDVQRKHYFRAAVHDINRKFMYMLVVPESAVDDEGFFEYGKGLWHRDVTGDYDRYGNGIMVADFYQGIIDQCKKPIFDIEYEVMRTVVTEVEGEIFENVQEDIPVAMSVPVLTVPYMTRSKYKDRIITTQFKDIIIGEKDKKIEELRLMLLITMVIAGISLAFNMGIFG